MRASSITTVVILLQGCFADRTRRAPLSAADGQRAPALEWLLRNNVDLSSHLTLCVDVGGQYLTDPREQPSAALLAPYQGHPAAVLPSDSCGPATPAPGASHIQAHRDSVWVSIGPALALSDSTALVDAGLWRGPLAAKFYRCRIVLRQHVWHLVNCYLAGIS